MFPQESPELTSYQQHIGLLAIPNLILNIKIFSLQILLV